MSEIKPSLQILKHPYRKGVFQLKSEFWLPVLREELFEFFSDAFKLEELTPPWLQFRVVTPKPIEMQDGITIDYRLKLHGFPLRWQSKITLWDPPFQFVDEQIRGPYRLWHHLHSFEPRDGGTLCRDDVDYSVLGGALANRFLVQGDIERIFKFRREKLNEWFAVSP